MTNPFDLWMRMMSTGLRMTETIVASDSVIRHRSGTIGDAMRDPLKADHVELNRMVAEKTEAFSTAGASIAADMMRLQFDMLAQAGAMATMLATGRAPSMQAATAMMNRSTRMASRALSSGDRALKPIHAKATANAKRLGTKK